MKNNLLILKAKQKQKRYFNVIKNNNDDSDSDGSLSDDDIEDLESNTIGEILNNKYIFIKYLGKGTFSKVWLIYDFLENICKVAKIFNDESIDEYESELIIMKKLNEEEVGNIHIIKFYDNFNYINNTKVIISEVLGISLLNIINDINDKQLPLNIENVINLYKQILEGFNYIHSKNIIHCDIKPDNILSDILPYNIEKIINYIKTLELPNVLENFITKLIPTDFNDFNKSKKKHIKKKIKHKSYKALRDYIITKLNSLVINDDDKNEYNKQKIIDNDFNIKIIDYSNSEFKNEISENELFINEYRPIENILNINYNCKVDIWVIGCIFYEILTGIELFSNCCDNSLDQIPSKVDKSKIHLYKITKIFGKINKPLLENCDFYDTYFFNDKIKFKNSHLLDNIEPFHKQVENNIILNLNTILVNKLIDFIKLLFEYNPNIRLDCRNLLILLNNF